MSPPAGRHDKRHQANAAHLVLIIRSPWILAARCHLQAVQRSRYAYGEASMASASWLSQVEADLTREDWRSPDAGTSACPP
jgi:hypothetical protein